MTCLDENALLRSQLAELEVSLQALKEENAMLRDEVERLRAQRVLSNEDFARSFDMGLRAAERERDELRHEVADLRMLRDEHMLDNQHAYDEGYDAGKRRGYEAERAAVVAYLRLEALEWDETGPGRAACRLTALTIERGEHRRGEGG
jgi:DNA-binding transcriptional regulator YiaG